MIEPKEYAVSPTRMNLSQYRSYLCTLGYRYKGSGAFGTVMISKDGTHVIKFGETKGNENYLLYVRYCQHMAKNKWMPRIYHAGVYKPTTGRGKRKNYFVVGMEVLTEIETKEYDKISTPFEMPREFVKLAGAKNGLINFRDKDVGDLLKVLNKLLKVGAELDIHDGNLMMRGKQPVVTDPVV